MSNSEIKSAVLPKALDLVHSPLLQGYAWTSLQRFFASMSDHFDELFQKLFGEVNGHVQQLSTAKCVAALISNGNPSQLDSTVQALCKQAKESSSEATRRLAMLCLGEIGRLVSLSGHQSVATLLASALEDSSEEIKGAASYALGAMTLGNLKDFLPDLVDKIRASQGQQRQLYLLLQSLNEVISSLNESGQPDPISNGRSLLSSNHIVYVCRVGGRTPRHALVQQRIRGGQSEHSGGMHRQFGLAAPRDNGALAEGGNQQPFREHPIHDCLRHKVKAGLP